MESTDNADILVVDDREDNIFVVEALICAYLPGTRVLKASNGLKGLEAARRNRVDVILSDLQMPVMDGIELCRAVKRDPQLAHIPFVLMTAHSTDVQTRIRGLEAGADDFILKPMDNSEFVARLKVMLRIKRAEDGLRVERDILAGKVTRTTRELDEAENRYGTLFNDLGDAIFIHHPNGGFREVNQETVRLLGYSREEFQGLRPGDVIPPGVPDSIWERTSHAVDGVGFFFETTLKTKDSRLIPVEVNSRATTYKGAPAILSVARDITIRKKMEKEKEELEAQLRQGQKMEAVGVLAGGIAHDFNNLLQIINGYAQILLLDLDGQDQFHKQLMEIQKAGERASRLVKQLLSFSRKTEINRKPIDLNKEVRQIVRILERTIPRMIEIEMRLDDRLWAVNADIYQIGQILLNLGGNAADAMPEGGKMVIETRNIAIREELEPNTLELSPGDYAVLSVSDTGLGMDQDTLGHIFEPFFTTKEVGKGTGLGLASVWGIVKSHGGCVVCESQPGQGATFFVYLPALVPEEDVGEEKEVEAPRNKGTETVLLVEDEAPIRDFVSRALERFGYDVLTAGSGEQALGILDGSSKAIGLVLLDLGMPGMGGQKCLAEILRIAPLAKVVIASGYSFGDEVKKAMEKGAVGYIAKPYRLAELIQTVRGALDAPPARG
ncbi:MAG: response regulator [Pseudomonadota bacterium]